METKNRFGAPVSLLAVLALALLYTAPAAAQTGTAEFHVAKPLQDGTVTITVSANGVTAPPIVADIKATDSAAQKQAKIKTALEAQGFNVYVVNTRKNGLGLAITDLPDGSEVKVDIGTTAEWKDRIKTVSGQSATLAYSGTFSSTGADGTPATFAAGIGTGRGEIFAEYRADDLPPGSPIPGSVIASRLYNSLLCAAADLGVSLTLAGDEILVGFGLVAGTERSITFGTTAAEAGVSGTIGPVTP